MRKLFFAVMSLLTVVAGCSESNCVELMGLDEKDERGTVSLKLKFDEPVGKALDDYDFVLDSEVIVNGIQVLVFDSLTGRVLNPQDKITCIRKIIISPGQDFTASGETHTQAT